jgi:hypothetical protein
MEATVPRIVEKSADREAMSREFLRLCISILSLKTSPYHLKVKPSRLVAEFASLKESTTNTAIGA